jgi:type II secretory pathway pseudopilin PulG
LNSGLTLVETIVSFAIVAVIAVVVIASFASSLGFQDKAHDDAASNASVEEQIAGAGAAASSTGLPGGGLNIKGRILPAEADTYTDGSRSYTVLDGSSPAQVTCWQFGDGAPGSNGSINTGAAGTGGNFLSFAATAAGTYNIELWGAQGDGAASGPAWHGAYGRFELALAENDTLELLVGGLGAAGASPPEAGGSSIVRRQDGTMLALVAGGDGQGGAASFILPTLSNKYTILGTGQMPDPSNPAGPTMTGRSGGGYIRITYLGA